MLVAIFLHIITGHHGKEKKKKLVSYFESKYLKFTTFTSYKK